MDKVDWGQVADFINVVGGLGGVVALVVVFWLKGTFVTKRDYEEDRKQAVTSATAASGSFATKTEVEAEKKAVETALATAAGALTALDARVTENEGAVTRVEGTLIRIEASLKAIPEVQEMHRLALSVERLNGTVTAVQAKLEGFGDLMQRVEVMVNRHEDHLLDRKA